MADLVNPMAAFRESYDTLQSLAQDRASRQAGQLLAGGDTTGASNALLQAGLLDQGLGLQQQQQQAQRQAMLDTRQQQQDQLQADALHRKEALDRIEWLGKAVTGLSQLQDPAARKQAYVQHIRPILQMMGADDASLAEYDNADFSDQSIAGWRAALGDAESKWQGVNLGNGGYGAFDAGAINPMALGPDGRPVGFRVLREPDAPKPPPGFTWGQDGQTLIPIPGGPADPRYVGTKAAAGRAPKAKKTGGSGIVYSDLPPGTTVIR